MNGRDVIPLQLRGRESSGVVVPLNTRLECNGCGACCEMLPLSQSPSVLADMEESAWRHLERYWWPHKDERCGVFEEMPLLNELADSKSSENTYEPTPLTWDKAKRDEVFLSHILPGHPSLRGSGLGNFRRDRDAIVICRMLHGRALGVWKGGVNDDKGPTLTTSRDHYLYGPCPHLQTEVDGQRLCGIYEARPMMCANFPYVGQGFTVEGATWRGCTLHHDPTFGLTIEEGKARLSPLDAPALASCTQGDTTQ